MPEIIKRYFAIGLKGWVQLRTALKPPREVITEAAIMVPEVRSRWVIDEANPWGHYVNSDIKKRINLKTTSFEGGRTVATIRAEKFARQLGIKLKEGGMVELSAEQGKAARVLDFKTGA